MNWLARIKTLICRTRLIVLIEFCHRCGRRQPLVWWMNNTELFKQIAGDEYTILCPMCIDKLAAKRGLFIEWKAEIRVARKRTAGDDHGRRRT